VPQEGVVGSTNTDGEKSAPQRATAAARRHSLVRGVLMSVLDKDIQRVCFWSREIGLASHLSHPLHSRTQDGIEDPRDRPAHGRSPHRAPQRKTGRVPLSSVVRTEGRCAPGSPNASLQPLVGLTDWELKVSPSKKSKSGRWRVKERLDENRQFGVFW
jgi:hypothetical protein